MPARHEDTQDHGKQQLFHNLSSFPAWTPLDLDISGPSLFIQQTARFFVKRQRRANPHVLPLFAPRQSVIPWILKLEIDRYIGLPIFKHFTIIGYRFCKKKISV